MLTRLIKRRLTDGPEQGAMLVLLAILIPLLLALGSVVVTVGNWYVHKKHLQTQVDAAALAGATKFSGCSSVFSASGANQAIRDVALDYVGDTSRDPSTTNLQVQQPTKTHALLNSNRYWALGDPTDNPTLSNPPYDNTLGTPCDTAFLDVKGTDDRAPLLWGWLKASPSPKTHARVHIFQEESQSGMLPWAVPEIDPASVAALFVNEDTGAIFDYQYLREADDAALPWSEWETFAGQESVTIGGANANTGVVILVSKNDPTPPLTGTLAQVCNQAPGLIKCHAGATATSGLSFIHGYQGGGTGQLNAPIIRQVSLTPVGCDPLDYTAAYFTFVGGCTAVVQAVADFGSPGLNPTILPRCVRIPGYTWAAGGLGGALGTWTGSVALGAGSGRNVVNLSWTSGPRNVNNCGNPNQQPNSGNFPKVAVPYVHDTPAGPVEYLRLTASFPAGGSVPDANSVEKNNTYNYVVKVGLPKPLKLEDPLLPALLLRMASPSGSQNQAFDCDKNVNFETEIENGCKTEYRLNYTDLDGDGDREWRNILCTGYNTTNLPSNPQPDPPDDCVMTETGDKTGQLRQGLAARFETPSCAPNNWPTKPASPAIDPEEVDDFFKNYDFANDPRYVTLIATDNTAFTGSGNEPLPVKYFAGFYATGWDVGGATSGCPDNEPHPLYGASYPPSKDNGDVWGHFVNIVVFSSSGTAGPEDCNFDEVGNCIAVLVE